LAQYAEELEAVASTGGILVRDLVLLNLSYEAHGGCTSIVVPLPASSERSGDEHHLMLGRTLDWQQPALRALTIELSFMRQGQLLYRATSFAGFLAIFTAHVPGPNGYAVAVNFRCEDEAAPEEGSDEDEEDGEQDEEEERVDEDDDANMQPSGHHAGSAGSRKHSSAGSAESVATTSGAAVDDDEFSFPVGYLVRHVLESCRDYASAQAVLHTAPLMSHTYFMLSAAKAEQGAVLITRDAFASVRPVKLQLDATGRKGSAAASSVAAASSSPAAAAAASSSSSSKGIGVLAAAAVPSAAALRRVPPALPSSSPWLVQANLDHWLTSKRLDHQQSLPRTRLVSRALTEARANQVAHTEARMWQLLSADPLWDEETIYATVSIPAQDRFISLVQCPHPPAKQQRAGGRKKKRLALFDA
jgi:hypothetical protein